MRRYLVCSLLGPDSKGLVDRITETILKNGANIEDSRMAVLGREFSITLLCSTTSERLDRLIDSIHQTADSLSFEVIIKPTDPATPPCGQSSYRLTVDGMDHEGIIHEIAHHLYQKGIAIQELESHTGNAPYSGSPIFSMSAKLNLPEAVSPSNLTEELKQIGEMLNVDITLQALT